VLARHIKLLKSGVARRVMWDSQIGVIRFLRDGGGNLTAVQEFWSWLPEDDANTEEPDAYTAYALSLEPTTAAPPAIP